MQRGRTRFSNINRITTAQRKGASKIKLLIILLILGTLAGMVTYVYFAWQKRDLSEIDGREAILANKSLSGEVDLLKKLRNAYDGNYVVSFTEKEINFYIAKRLKMKQGGALKGFSKIKGVYVDLSPDIMEVFIEREIAQYGEDGEPNTQYIKPFDHTVSIKFNIYTSENTDNAGTTNVCNFPGGTIGKSPAPGMFITVMKPSYDMLKEFFSEEINFAFTRIIDITIEEGKVTLDPRKRYKK